MDKQSSLQKFDLMFLTIHQGYAKCRICSKLIEIVDPLEGEFWKHQTDGDHQQAALNFILSHLQGNKQQQEDPQSLSLFDLRKAQKLKSRGTEEYDDYLHEQAYQALEHLNKMGETLGIESLELLVNLMQEMVKKSVGAVDAKLLNDFSKEMNVFDRDLISQIASRLGIILEQKRDEDTKQKKKYLKKEWKQEPFLLSYNDYFHKFIGKLINENHLIESSCFLLARLGINVNQMMKIQISKIQNIIRKAQSTQVKPENWIEKIFVKILTNLQADEKYKENNNLARDYRSVKELRKRLQMIRNEISKNSNDILFQAFLSSLRVKALNALYKTGQKRAIVQEQVEASKPLTDQEEAQDVDKKENEKQIQGSSQNSQFNEHSQSNQENNKQQEAAVIVEQNKVNGSKADQKESEQQITNQNQNDDQHKNTKCSQSKFIDLQ